MLDVVLDVLQKANVFVGEAVPYEKRSSYWKKRTEHQTVRQEVVFYRNNLLVDVVVGCVVKIAIEVTLVTNAINRTNWFMPKKIIRVAVGIVLQDLVHFVTVLTHFYEDFNG